MNATFYELLPELVEPVEAALRCEGYFTQADSLSSLKVERWTYDPSVDAGYIYFAQRKPIHHGETPAATSLAFMFELGFNVDLRDHGEIFGIELLEHGAIFNRLAITDNQ